MHPEFVDDELVERALHGELPKAAEEALRAHLAGCDECRAHVAEAARREAEVNALLARLDRPAPAVTVQAITSRALASRATAAHPSASRAHPPHRARTHTMSRWSRIAAGIVVALAAAGVAWAAPDSPFPALVRRVIGSGARTGVALDVQAPATQAAEPAEAAGVSSAPGAHFVIEFVSRGDTTAVATALVTLTDGPDVVVRTLGGDAAYRSDAQRLTVSAGARAPRLAIEVPRGAAHVELRADGRRLLVVEGGRVRGDSLPVPATGRLVTLRDPAPHDPARVR